MAKSSTSGQGRPRGSLNKATADIKALAGKYSPKAIERLAHLMIHAESEAAQVAACKEIIDRAHGKASQPIGGADDLPPIAVQEIKRTIVRP